MINLKNNMDKPMFPNSNQLAEEALLELQQRLTEISKTDEDIDIENKDLTFRRSYLSK